MATVPTYIYGDTCTAVLNIARSRVNDLILTPSGQPTGADPGQQLTEVGGGTLLQQLNADGSLCLRTQIIFNNAWRKCQKYLGNLGYRLLIKDNVIISNVPVNNNADPSAQTWISWNGCFDGTTFSSSPVLPADFIAPLKIRARQSGQNSVFWPIRCALDGIETNYSTRAVLNTRWEWRSNALYLPGATALNDLQLRYTTYLPDFVATGSPATPWYYQIVPIPRIASALAWYIAIEVCYPRGDESGYTEAVQLAQGEADEVFNDQARADQRTNLRRKPRGGRNNSSRGGYGYGYGY